ncbi:hypothetical protein ACFP7A_04290 [Sporolactobacillus kofuensis]|uniref:Hydrolase n=1 Tax=Sporolactobacillus kofuensis TaxID=269672 RepID=A0ABW1WE14_9BACL|nr:hypothetical protein [Sporolactobacillus kofuensis]MCO7174939.1 hypothetical protein [Sporolactobacillus kofuensis]
MNVLNRVFTRLKKYLWVVLALPVLLGVLGWLIPVGKMPSEYDAQATIQLGDYENNQYNDPQQVILLLSNLSFYEQNSHALGTDEAKTFMTRINVSEMPNHLIQISYRAQKANDAIDGVHQITNAFLKMDSKHFDEKEKVIDQTIHAMKTMNPEQGETVNRERFLYKLQNEKLKMRPAQLLQAAKQGSNSGVTTLSSKKRAVLGIMLGITLVLIAAALPEFVRKREDV